MPLSGHKNACLHYSIKLDFILRQQEGVKIYTETHEDQRQNHGGVQRPDKETVLNTCA
jgi:hypothetical protein